MSFLTRRREIALGDTVILYVNFNSLYPVTVREDYTQQTPMGAVPTESLVGAREEGDGGATAAGLIVSGVSVVEYLLYRGPSGRTVFSFLLLA